MSFREFLKSSVNEAFSAQSIRKGGIYLAKESGAKDFSKADKVKILSVTKDSSGDYDVKVEFLDTGKKDSWYLYRNEKIFMDLKESKAFLKEDTSFGAQVIKVGKSYLAKKDADSDSTDADEVQILKVRKRGSRYEVDVKYLNTGEKEVWELGGDERIFLPLR